MSKIVEYLTEYYGNEEDAKFYANLAVRRTYNVVNDNPEIKIDTVLEVIAESLGIEKDFFIKSLMP